MRPANVLRFKTTRSEYRLYWFLVVQFVCQAALMMERLGGIRTLLRAVAFASSLIMLALLTEKPSRPHPAKLIALAFLTFMGMGLVHPNANHLSGIAHWLLNIAIWAPLFWIGRTTVTARTLGNLLLLLWFFHLGSSLIGVLQVYYPDRFAPSAQFVREMLGTSADGLLINRADGKQVWRPFGLSDTPGGAAVSGSFAAVVGIFILLAKPGFGVRLLAVGGILAGFFCLYTCEIRSIMVTTVVGSVVLVALQFYQGKVTRSAAAILFLPLIFALALSWTRSIGDERLGRRLHALTEESASETYYKSRGFFVTMTITDELPKYPLGAGLGRYGMMYRYFGDKRSRDSTAMFVEVQITAWLYDGGVPLVVLGYGALFVASFATLRIAVSRRVSGVIADYATVITALNAGWIAASFNNALFEGPSGMIFWLLNGAVFAAASLAPPRAPHFVGQRTDRLSKQPSSVTQDAICSDASAVGISRPPLSS
ncbi:MAG: hypothetical protein C0483_16335 [Pirellula sp.]|nr:hypothetical protein [Pirellula sp.]